MFRLKFSFVVLFANQLEMIDFKHTIYVFAIKRKKHHRNIDLESNIISITWCKQKKKKQSDTQTRIIIMPFCTLIKYAFVYFIWILCNNKQLIFFLYKYISICIYEHRSYFQSKLYWTKCVCCKLQMIDCEMCINHGEYKSYIRDRAHYSIENAFQMREREWKELRFKLSEKNDRHRIQTADGRVKMEVRRNIHKSLSNHRVS